MKKLCGDINDIKNWVLLVAQKFERVEIKNEEALKKIMDSLKISDGDSIINNNEYNGLIESKLGTFIESNEEYICGYYISTTGKVYTIFDQHSADTLGTDNVRWNGKCNRAATIIVASASSDKTKISLIDEINQYKGDRTIPENDYWNEFGLERSKYYGWMPTYGDDTTQGYTEVLSEHLKNGGTAVIWLNSYSKDGNSNNDIYKGKSEKEWTKAEVGTHWVAVIDYKSSEVKGQVDQIAIADYSGVEWYDIDEFNKNISNMVLINEMSEQ